MEIAIVQAAVLCVVTGAVSSLLTVGAIKVDLRNLRATVSRIDSVSARAHETGISNTVRIEHLERRRANP